MNIAIVLSGGSGARFGSQVPKQYHLLNGVPVYAYALNAIAANRAIDATIYVGDASFLDALYFPENFYSIPGGFTRNESLTNAIRYISDNFSDCTRVCILEAARPFVDTDVISAHLNLLTEYDCVINAKKITDSLSRTDGSFSNRDDFYLIQAPESYRYCILVDNFSESSGTTSPMHQLPKSAKIKFYLDMPINLKITYESDLVIAEALVEHLKNNEEKN